MDGSPPGSSVQGILQARTLEWVAISFSKEITIILDNLKMHPMKQDMSNTNEYSVVGDGIA